MLHSPLSRTFAALLGLWAGIAPATPWLADECPVPIDHASHHDLGTVPAPSETSVGPSGHDHLTCTMHCCVLAGAVPTVVAPGITLAPGHFTAGVLHTPSLPRARAPYLHPYAVGPPLG